TGISALLTAITGLFLALHQTGVIGGPSASAPTAQKEPMPSGEAAGRVAPAGAQATTPPASHPAPLEAPPARNEAPPPHPTLLPPPAARRGRRPGTPRASPGGGHGKRRELPRRFVGCLVRSGHRRRAGSADRGTERGRREPRGEGRGSPLPAARRSGRRHAPH